MLSAGIPLLDSLQIPNFVWNQITQIWGSIGLWTWDVQRCSEATESLRGHFWKHVKLCSIASGACSVAHGGCIQSQQVLADPLEVLEIHLKVFSVASMDHRKAFGSVWICTPVITRDFRLGQIGLHGERRTGIETKFLDAKSASTFTSNKYWTFHKTRIPQGLLSP